VANAIQRRTQYDDDVVREMQKRIDHLTHKCAYLTDVITDAADQLDKTSDSSMCVCTHILQMQFLLGLNSVGTTHAADLAYITQQTRRIAQQLRHTLHKNAKHAGVTETTHVTDISNKQ
jgi:hypothetical protein